MSEEYTGKTYEESTANVLGRWSVQDLKEQPQEAMEAAMKRDLSGDNLVVLERGTTNFINFWKIGKGEKVYHCRRFQNFVWCSCSDFFYRKRICRHLAASLQHCWQCILLSANGGKLCNACEEKAREHRLAA